MKRILLIIINILIIGYLSSANNIDKFPVYSLTDKIDIKDLIKTYREQRNQTKFQIVDSFIEDTLIVSPVLTFNINASKSPQCDVLFISKGRNNRSTKRVIFQNDSIIEEVLLKGSAGAFNESVIKREIKRLTDIMMSFSPDFFTKYGITWYPYPEENRFIIFYYQIIPSCKP